MEKRVEKKNMALLQTVVTERIFTMKIDEDHLKDIIAAAFPEFGKNIEISINNSCGYFDSVTVTLRQSSVTQNDIMLSDLSK